MPAVELRLTDDLRVNNPGPAPGVGTISVEADQVLALQSADGGLAIECEPILPVVMAPIVPSPEMPVHLAVAIDGVVGAAGVDDQALAGVQMLLQLLVGG